MKKNYESPLAEVVDFRALERIAYIPGTDGDKSVSTYAETNDPSTNLSEGGIGTGGGVTGKPW